MKIFAFAITAALVLTAALAFLVSNKSRPVMAQEARLTPAPQGQDATRITAIRQFGLKEERSQIPMLIALLEKPGHPYFKYAAVHALAQMGAVEALPIFDTLLPTTIMKVSSDADLTNFTRVAKARLLAENNARGIVDAKGRAAAKASHFMTELGVDVDQLNTAQTLNKELSQRTTHAATMTNLYALRELADMVYKDKDVALADHLRESGIRFDTDVPSEWKIRLAALTPQERIDLLVNELSAKRVLRGDDYHIIQLAIYEGLPAAQAVAVKLKEMDGQRDKYTYIGFAALFYVLHGISSKEQLPLIEKFSTDSNKWIAHYAQYAYRDMSKGVPGQEAIGY